MVKNRRPAVPSGAGPAYAGANKAGTGPAGTNGPVLAKVVFTVNGARRELELDTRTSLLEGLWDSTATLASNMPKVRQVAGRLPYLNGFRS